MTRLIEAANFLRKQSSAYGGIPHYLAATGKLEKAILAFVRDQTVENLAELNGAYARVTRFTMQAAAHAAAHAEQGPEVA